jgi:hypothetical protein
LATGHTANRNEQFENIDRLKQEYRDAGNPIIVSVMNYSR